LARDETIAEITKVRKREKAQTIPSRSFFS